MAAIRHRDTDGLRITCDCQDDDNDVYADTAFTILDIIRMLVGLVLMWCIMSRSFTGHWFYIVHQGLNSSKQTDGVLPKFSRYFSNQELPIEFTLDQLSEYSGQGEMGIILLSIKGHVFDVTEGESFYGRQGVYRKFAGTDCSNLFGYCIWDFSVLGKKCNHDLSNLSEKELTRVNAWLDYFTRKYPEIGYLKVP